MTHTFHIHMDEIHTEMLPQFVCLNNAGGCSYKANIMSSFNSVFAMILVKMSKMEALENLQLLKKIHYQITFLVDKKTNTNRTPSFQNV